MARDTAREEVPEPEEEISVSLTLIVCAQLWTYIFLEEGKDLLDYTCLKVIEIPGILLFPRRFRFPSDLIDFFLPNLLLQLTNV